MIGNRLDIRLEILRIADTAATGDDLESSAFSNEDKPAAAGAVTASTAAGPPCAAAAKLAVRTVMTFFASPDFTVWVALPA